jgi:hypothetical protein
MRQGCEGSRSQIGLNLRLGRADVQPEPRAAQRLVVQERS